ncbi:ROK family protein [Streptomyces sp. SKN60]|uniref:ROK family transcriptional regulator n=1 Tax=Streptomyces sp. SKN60 TaxID=2855506 RepID=UPI0022484ED9|nr:ROK family transcriptional regulator [Streptomyces sp. SKN60]MCX2183894.1 ROK family protein [Streptomyces sp. SKN60]
MPPTPESRAPITTPAAAAVFTTVLTRGPVSRVEIARRTGLSSAAVTRTARPIIEAGYLEELEAEERNAPGAGRPASPLSIRADREFFIGVKITGEDLIGVVCDLRAETRASRHHVLTDRTVDGVVAALAELVEALLSESDAYRERTHCLGVAVSGDVDRASGVVRYSPLLGRRDVPLARLLTEATGLVTTLENDVKSLTVAEQWFGEGVEASSFALVTVGAGIGCALVLNGGLVAGEYNVAGELGHLRVAASGPVCHCGGSGCIETLASTEAIVAHARRASGDPELSMTQAVERARAGDEAVRHAFDRAGHAIGLGLAAVANLVGPGRIVVSGAGLAAYDLLEPQIRESFAEQAFGAAARCVLVIRPLPFEEWARGAAAVALQTLFTAESI